ncbi:uncharacterized protein MYCGRDRAFT_97580 [Zymoseptoria tritici IPO323]|uniref:Uncharacterized protein n=1 Tax=Zymoseptoria tritici (strain CBS 115943 / IPO323) TaxID=336722 RepID=F9XQP4_ZYMTI|nr:uncharacterized protein MYCGRDRAFT_97580 [Zymoseptoria tritici IPO323]EGP82450.1 hypothetical protein MYCGRDRAFT_97580 [Zymoseptoria tritici IPO323]
MPARAPQHLDLTSTSRVNEISHQSASNQNSSENNSSSTLLPDNQSTARDPDLPPHQEQGNVNNQQNPPDGTSDAVAGEDPNSVGSDHANAIASVRGADGAEAMDGVEFAPNPSFRGALTADGESYLAEIRAPVVGTDMPWRRLSPYHHERESVWRHIHHCLLTLSNNPENQQILLLLGLWNDMLMREVGRTADRALDTTLWPLKVSEARRCLNSGDSPETVRSVLSGIANELRSEARRKEFPAGSLDWGLGVHAWEQHESANLPGFRSVNGSGVHSYLSAHNKVWFVDRNQRQGEHGQIVGWKKQGHGHQFILKFGRGEYDHYLLIKASYFGKGAFNEFERMNREPSVSDLDRVVNDGTNGISTKVDRTAYADDIKEFKPPTRKKKQK